MPPMSGTIGALNVTIKKPDSSLNTGGAAPCCLHRSITRLVPRPQISTAPVRWKASAIKGLVGFDLWGPDSFLMVMPVGMRPQL